MPPNTVTTLGNQRFTFAAAARPHRCSPVVTEKPMTSGSIRRIARSRLRSAFSIKRWDSCPCSVAYADRAVTPMFTNGSFWM